MILVLTLSCSVCNERLCYSMSDFAGVQETYSFFSFCLKSSVLHFLNALALGVSVPQVNRQRFSSGG